MTVASSTRKAGPFLGNGVTTSYPFTFKVFTASDIAVTRTDALGGEFPLALSLNYSVLLNADQDNNPGGTVTYPITGTALPTGERLTILGATPATQGTDLTAMIRFQPQAFEDALDKTTILYQQLAEKVGRALLFPAGDTVAPTGLVTAANRGGKFLGFDGAGQPVMLSGTGGGDTALRTDLAATSGPALIGFSHAFAYTAGTLGAKAKEVISVKDAPYNAVGNGVTNDTAAIQAAIAAAQASTCVLFFPPGNYLITSALQVTSGLEIRGSGKYKSFIVLNSTTQDGINFATLDPVHMEKICVAGKTNATAGNLVSLDSGNAVSPNVYSSFRDVRFQNGFRHLVPFRAGSFTLECCQFMGWVDSSVVLQNTLNADAGDVGIVDCFFVNAVGIGTAVLQLSAGGCRFINNKVIAMAIGYHVALAAGVNTSDLFIIGNSFEAFSGSIVQIERTAGSGTFNNIVISANELAAGFEGINIAGDSGPWMGTLAITGNVIQFNAGGVGIDLHGVTNFTVTGNTVAGSGTGTGIRVGTVATNGVIANNPISSVTTPFNNNSPATDLRIESNPGYNPVGAVVVTPAASPYVHVNGPSPADLSLSATTGISQITLNGVSGLLAAPVPSAAPYSIRLGPNESVTITYAGTLTVKKMVH